MPKPAAVSLAQQPACLATAGRDCALSAGMDGWVRICDLGTGSSLLDCPLGWRGPQGSTPEPQDWESFEVVTSLQLSPDGRLLLAGCMDGAISLLDLRTATQTVGLKFAPSSRAGASAAAPAFQYWAPRRGRDALCCARMHGHLVVAGGDAPAVVLYDLRRALSSRGGGSIDSSSIMSSGGTCSAKLAELDMTHEAVRRPKVGGRASAPSALLVHRLTHASWRALARCLG